MNGIASVKNLVFVKQKKEILNIPELYIPENKIISIVGPSGAGKTTLLNLLSKIETPKSAEITLFNNMQTAQIGYILQENFLYEEISVFHNIYLSAKNSFVWRHEKRLEFLQNFDAKYYLSPFLQKLINKYKETKNEKKERWLFYTIWHFLFFKYMFKNKNAFKVIQKESKLKQFFKKDLDFIADKVEIKQILKQKAQNISGGQKQRVLIAKAIIKKSTLMLMDEPFSALDVKIKEKTIEWILKIKKEFNLSIILVTHDQNDALKLSDYIMVMNNGRIEQFDTKDKVLEEPASYFVAHFFCSPRLNLIKEDDIYKYFVKPKDIQISLSTDSEWIVRQKENIADLTIYTIQNQDKEYVVSNTNSTLNILDKVDVNIPENKIMSFKHEEVIDQQN
ncbi:ATP-binding cassette domain-containing protein [Mycoplasma sp. AC1221]